MKKLTVVVVLVLALVGAIAPPNTFAAHADAANITTVHGTKLTDTQLQTVHGGASWLDVLGQVLRFVRDVYDAITNPSPPLPMLY